MKRKEYLFALLFLVAIVTFLVTGVIVGEAQSAEIARIERIEQTINRTAQYFGYESLGVVDCYEVSKRNGNIYDGPAITKELFEQNGLSVPDNTFTTYFCERDGIMIHKMYVFEGERKLTQPVMQQKIDKIYLYGTI